MITYDLTKANCAIYKYLYECIKEDISSGKFEADMKMPSKRSLANNLGISTITVENAYDQLISEGYMYTIVKKGYFVSNIADIKRVQAPVQKKLNIKKADVSKDYFFDFSSNRTENGNFPFSVWAKLMREVIASNESKLLTVSPSEGVEELRVAIANHLSSFRGMAVDPNQIIVGAGTEYLYGLIVKLLGNDKLYCIENPGHKKIKKIYETNGVKWCLANLDYQGMKVDELRNTKAHIAHISSTHHFPTGISMPISRRYEMLAWANEEEGRYIIEDDYDSEFRIKGKPIPPIQSIDACEKVIYMNTFSKSLASTIRISYMVLPEHLANKYYEMLSFMSCTVSTFEQYTLATFIKEGYFEKHINRMRLHYGRKRKAILDIIRNKFCDNEVTVLENDSGLHFILRFNTGLSDKEVKNLLEKKKIRIETVSDYSLSDEAKDDHYFILNYSNVDIDGIASAFDVIKEILHGYDIKEIH